MEKKIMHFAHKNKCTYPYWEPESDEHIKGKLLLKYRLEKLYPRSKVYLEFKVVETNQRSDVMVIHPNSERWAFEVQLSKIPIATLKERHELYKSAGVFDFWLLGTNAYSVVNLRAYEKEVRKLLEICNVSWHITFVDEMVVAFKGELTEVQGVEKPYSILINKPFGKSINAKHMIVSKNNYDTTNYYDLKSESRFKTAYSYYKSAKIAIKTHFENYYKKSKAYMDYKIEGSNEKADIMLVSENGGKCAINIIFEFLPYKNGEDRINVYKENNITTFWLYGQLVYMTEKNLADDPAISFDYKYYLTYDEDEWYIFNYAEYLRRSPIELNNIIFKYSEKHETFLLDDKRFYLNGKRIIQIKEKKIVWKKDKEKWIGLIYSCPKQEYMPGDFHIEDISTCEKYIKFMGDKSEGYKKLAVKCSVL